MGYTVKTCQIVTELSVLALDIEKVLSPYYNVIRSNKINTSLNPDVLILDADIPGSFGALRKILRMNRKSTGVLITSQPYDSIPKDFKKLIYFPKPLDSSRLLNTIKQRFS